MAAPGALTDWSRWLAAETGGDADHGSAWITTGAIISLDLAAIAGLFSGPMALAAGTASLCAVPAIALVWAFASPRRPRHHA